MVGVTAGHQRGHFPGTNLEQPAWRERGVDRPVGGRAGRCSPLNAYPRLARHGRRDGVLRLPTALDQDTHHAGANLGPAISRPRRAAWTNCGRPPGATASCSRPSAKAPDTAGASGPASVTTQLRSRAHPAAPHDSPNARRFLHAFRRTGFARR